MGYGGSAVPPSPCWRVEDGPAFPGAPAQRRPGDAVRWARFRLLRSAMTERDIDDIDFDFFDEPETEEATERHQRIVRRPQGPRDPGGGGPRRPIRPAQGL